MTKKYIVALSLALISVGCFSQTKKQDGNIKKDLFNDFFKETRDNKHLHKGIYYYNQGDIAKIIEINKQAEEKGLLKPQDNYIGNVTKDSLRPEDNYKKALECFMIAAKLGNSDAKRYIGKMYEKGKGVKNDINSALFWYEKSANQGSIKAQIYLGGLFYNGIGVKKNPKKAFYWYKKSAESGDADTAFVVGMMYYFGEGIEKNLQQTQY
ncbi:tetratricopeptide repeat protein [Marinifilum fragile]|uniref:tetratricopeptide repeat protein n=1 Tax=Marinifilum fragile TaxID=570161 RepID=UPI002AA655C0|nr:tetratricopeptide repeat protein [Marinifilum fragile]